MAMTKAMQDAGVAPDEIDYIAAHGTSHAAQRRHRDARHQGGASERTPTRWRSRSTKSMVGHTIGAAGVINALAAIGAIREGVHPADDQSRQS